MFKGTITTDTAVTANTNIPFNVVWNTNGNTAYNKTDNAVELRTSGFYDVIVTVQATTGTSGATVTAQLYADGEAIPESASTEVLGGTTTSTFTLADTVRVLVDRYPNVADISVRFDTAMTVNSAVITVEKRK